MAKVYDKKNISMMEGESFVKRFRLTMIENSLPHPFGQNDAARVAIRDKYGKKIFKKIFPIKAGYFDFRLTPEDSARIEPGSYRWDFSVLLGVRREKKGRSTVLKYDKLIPAFSPPGMFDVKEVISA